MSFIWGDGGEQLTIDQIKRRRDLAEKMMERGSDYSPVQHWTQGLARVMEGLTGGLAERRAGQAEKANFAADKAMIEKLFGGGTPAATPAPATVPLAAPQADAGSSANAIASIESGGRYDALGPVTKTGDRAFGKYQVMGQNVGPWSEAALGKPLTPEAFLADPAAQDAIFKAKFGQYAAKYGPEGAARAWFAGEGGMNDPTRKDQLGTTVQAYADKFNRALGGPHNGAMALAPTGVPTAPISAPQAPQPQQSVAKAMGGLNPALLTALTSPYSSEGTKKIAAILFQQQLGEQKITHVDAGDKIILMDARGRQIGAIPKGEPVKSPAIVEGEVDPTTGYPVKLMQRGDKVERLVVPPSGPVPAAAAAPAIPPPPPGVRAKEWYEAVSKQGTGSTLELPGVLAKAQQSVDLIDTLTKHPGRETATGLSSVIDPRNYIPGTDSRDFQVKQRQLQGKAFLEAYETLKGGGQITEVEGKKATEAIASLDTSQSDAAYMKSLKDLREVITAGMDRMRARADLTYKPQPQAKPSGTTKTGVGWSID